MTAYDLTMLADQLTAARDKAYLAAAEAMQRITELREERSNGSPRGDSLFADIYRENAADRAREVALAEWAATALALSGLHLSTNGAYGVRYQDSPSPYRTRREDAGVECVGGTR